MQKKNASKIGEYDILVLASDKDSSDQISKLLYCLVYISHSLNPIEIKFCKPILNILTIVFFIKKFPWGRLITEMIILIPFLLSSKEARVGTVFELITTDLWGS